MNEPCPLCDEWGEAFYRDVFFICNDCRGIYKAKRCLPTPEQEKKRYQEHNNDVTDAGYLRFVSPITNAVQSDFSTSSLGLDYGAGTGPVISSVLAGKGYVVKQYDPLFINDTVVLRLQYDYIVCCEVIEHFHSPAKEFASLKKMLKPNGRLYCMTHVFGNEIHFDTWYYKNDHTHVFFYQLETLERIKDMCKFSALSIANRLITYIN